MKKIVFDSEAWRHSFNLRLFDDDGADNEGTDDAGNDAGSDGSDEEAAIQARIDKAVSAALRRERAKADKKAKEAAEAERLRNMTEAERQAERLKALEAEVTTLKGEKARGAMASTVRGMLSQAGVSGYDDAIVDSLVVADDADATKGRVDTFVKSYKAAVNAGILAATAGRTPKARGGAKPASMTKAEIMAIEDPIERQRAIKNNISLFQ